MPAYADDPLYLSTESGKKAQKGLSRSNLAPACLDIVIITKDLMSKACKSRGVECPEELAHPTSQDKIEEHQPKDQINKAEV